MIKKERFYFIRHGKTDWNEKKLCQGQVDVPLNKAGINEIEKICPWIADLDFSKIVSSPLIRALESAKIIQNHTSFSLEVVKELQERSWGEMEGAASLEMYAIEEREESDRSFVPGFNIELRSKFMSRILLGMNSILKQDVPLVVSHGRVFLVLLEILGLPRVRQIPNATVMECIPLSKGWKITLHKKN